MTITIDKLAKILQTLFTTEADTAAKESGMIQRRRISLGSSLGSGPLWGRSSLGSSSLFSFRTFEGR